MTSVCFHPNECRTGCTSHTPTNTTLLSVARTVSAIALFQLAASIAPELCLSFFAIGCGIGLYQVITDQVADFQKDGTMGCSRGLMEQLTGIIMPPLIALAIDVAVMYCHVEHHPSVFVPMISLYSGATVSLFALDKMGFLSQ